MIHSRDDERTSTSAVVELIDEYGAGVRLRKASETKPKRK